MVIVRLQGGLGNQLFQYVAGLVVAKGRTDQILVDTSYYWYVRNRRYVLDVLGLHPQQLSLLRRPAESLLAWPLLGPWWQKGYSSFGQYQIVEEHGADDLLPIMKDVPRFTYLSGFWQQRSYVELVQQKLRQQLKFPALASAQAQKLAKEIAVQNSVAVHVRRGDYVHHPTFHVCPPEYYERAFAYLKKHLKQPHFFIFSDDIAWCKKQFGNLEHVTFVKGVTGENSEIDELNLMTQCQAHVIANSTFSWWGALLASHGKTVIAPKNWNGDTQSAKKLLRPDWIQL